MTEPVNYEMLFMDSFKKLCTHRSAWQVWADFVTVTAISISNVLESDADIFKAREREAKDCGERLGDNETLTKLFNIIVSALESNPRQDFLGSLYMHLELGSHWKGQFFTPYHICELMAGLGANDRIEELKNGHWISVNDCACGAGATLLAMANKLREADINYQERVLFVAQDIDRITGMMCYIQLSLLGCPGYVVIADSLCNPLTGRSPLMPALRPGQEIWCTPMFYTDTWHYRRLIKRITGGQYDGHKE